MNSTHHAPIMRAGRAVTLTPVLPASSAATLSLKTHTHGYRVF